MAGLAELDALLQSWDAQMVGNGSSSGGGGGGGGSDDRASVASGDTAPPNALPPAHAVERAGGRDGRGRAQQQGVASTRRQRRAEDQQRRHRLQDLDQLPANDDHGAPENSGSRRSGGYDRHHAQRRGGRQQQQPPPPPQQQQQQRLQPSSRVQRPASSDERGIWRARAGESGSSAVDSLEELLETMEMSAAATAGAAGDGRASGRRASPAPPPHSAKPTPPPAKEEDVVVLEEERAGPAAAVTEPTTAAAGAAAPARRSRTDSVDAAVGHVLALSARGGAANAGVGRGSTPSEARAARAAAVAAADLPPPRAAATPSPPLRPAEPPAAAQILELLDDLAEDVGKRQPEHRARQAPQPRLSSNKGTQTEAAMTGLELSPRTAAAVTSALNTAAGADAFASPDEETATRTEEKAQAASPPPSVAATRQAFTDLVVTLSRRVLIALDDLGALALQPDSGGELEQACSALAAHVSRNAAALAAPAAEKRAHIIASLLVPGARVARNAAAAVGGIAAPGDPHTLDVAKALRRRLGQLLETVRSAAADTGTP